MDSLYIANVSEISLEYNSAVVLRVEGGDVLWVWVFFLREDSGFNSN